MNIEFGFRKQCSALISTSRGKIGLKIAKKATINYLEECHWFMVWLIIFSTGCVLYGYWNLLRKVSLHLKMSKLAKLDLQRCPKPMKNTWCLVPLNVFRSLIWCKLGEILGHFHLFLQRYGIKNGKNLSKIPQKQL